MNIIVGDFTGLPKLKASGGVESDHDRCRRRSGIVYDPAGWDDANLRDQDRSLRR